MLPKEFCIFSLSLFSYAKITFLVWIERIRITFISYTHFNYRRSMISANYYIFSWDPLDRIMKLHNTNNQRAERENTSPFFQLKLLQVDMFEVSFFLCITVQCKRSCSPQWPVLLLVPLPLRVGISTKRIR